MGTPKPQKEELMLTLKAFVGSAFLSSEVLWTLLCPLSKLLKVLVGVGWDNLGLVSLALGRKRTSHAKGTCPCVGIYQQHPNKFHGP